MRDAEPRDIIRAAAVSFLYGNDWSLEDLTALADALDIRTKDRPAGLKPRGRQRASTKA